MACCSQFTSSTTTTTTTVSARAQAQRPQRHLLLPPLLQPISRPPSSRSSLKLVAPLSSRRDQTTPAVARASPEDERGVVPSDGDDGEGVSLGTMKLPPDTDLQRFETLLFQWANSLCQGANLPLPVPLKVDKIPGGARLGFITIGDGQTEVLVYIDCLVSPPTDGSVPIFRATRNGQMKDQAPPGELRIMRSLLAALKKSVEIARL
ncbi:uncharacterized protein LOC115687950 isoform X2 [Syzygium oleosum]|uniref:uncharacterized protein LOC115687950 isoform X1 n=1 Tax=Syzygium oleosum TaxID=219896 RepID=UPI0024BA6E76|nr:uncharacterized protein LOC115687950 isoform X1 [Syzygium oleosum]XP_030469525.2 uncharacterized protein LOC115687950 isoform X2 [Syzygium oleosum]